MTYPRRVTEAFVTSDGRFFERAEDADAHEMTFRVERAIRDAVRSARYHDFGEYRYVTDVGYVDSVVRELRKAGLRFQ